MCVFFSLSLSPFSLLSLSFVLQNNPGERVWELTAEGTEVATEWANILMQQVAARYVDGELPPLYSSEREEEEEEIAGIALWMHKQGEGLGGLTGEKKRFFTLVFGEQSKTLKLCYYAQLQHGRPINRKGHIVVTPATGLSCNGKALSLVYMWECARVSE